MALTGGTPNAESASAGLETALDLDDPETARLVEAASAIVDRYAAGAPEAVRDEAVVRVAGYLAECPPAPIRHERVGEISTGFHRDSQSALRHSGAMALLSPWKVRRAGAI